MKKKRDARLRGWVLARYVYPLVMIVLILISLSIPCLRYTTADTGTNETISQWELMGNSWEQSRQYLFGTEKQTTSNILFCQAVLWTLVGFYLLFFTGAAATVWASVGAICYILNPQKKGTGRTLYLTLFPNRAACCLWSALMLPLLIFPRLLILFYRRYFYYSVMLNVTFPEPMLIGGILFLILVGITVGFAGVEKRREISPFPKKRPKGLPEEREESYEPQFKTHGEDPYDELSRRARAEQAERIRRLLDGEDPSQTNENGNEKHDE